MLKDMLIMNISHGENKKRPSQQPNKQKDRKEKQNNVKLLKVKLGISQIYRHWACNQPFSFHSASIPFIPVEDFISMTEYSKEKMNSNTHNPSLTQDVMIDCLKGPPWIRNVQNVKKTPTEQLYNYVHLKQKLTKWQTQPSIPCQ